MLVLRALGLGDLCTVVPALRGLRAAWPHGWIQLAAPAWLRPLVSLIDAVDEHVALDGLGPLPAAVHGPEVAVNLHGRGPQSTNLLAACAPRSLLAFAHPASAAGRSAPPWRPDEHEVLRWCRLLGSHGIACDPDDLSLPAPSDGPAVVEGVEAGTVLVHLGASAPARRWPAESWAAVVTALRADGHRVTLTGDAQDRPAADTVAAAASLPPGSVLAGRTDLASLLALVADARLVLCGDTGVAHVATAMAVPSVVLFGPVPPSEWGPRRGPHTALWAGGRGDPHGSVVDAGLARVAPAEVIRAARLRLAT